MRLYDNDALRHDNESNGIAYRPPKSISSFVAGFKSAVSHAINEMMQSKRDSIWQTRFHDHVIRDHHEHRVIEHYIDTNVERWNEDKFRTKQ